MCFVCLWRQQWSQRWQQRLEAHGSETKVAVLTVLLEGRVVDNGGGNFLSPAQQVATAGRAVSSPAATAAAAGEGTSSHRAKQHRWLREIRLHSGRVCGVSS